MTTPDFVQVPPDAAGGKKVDTTQVAVGANTVERQVIVIADPADPAGYAVVTGSAVAGTERALVVRTIPSGTQAVAGVVSVTNFPATQPVSGTVAISNLPATQPVSGTVAVSNFPATQPVSGPLTDTQLRASAVPVSGPATDAQMRASALNIDRPGDGINRDLLAAVATVTPGSPLVVAPSAGKAIRLWWASWAPGPDNSATGTVTATLAGKGVIYRQVAVGHRQRFDGSVNGTLTVASTNGTFEVTVHYEEI